jgi:2-iminoacetate synthase
MMFSDYLDTLNWEHTTERIYSKTEADVVRALRAEKCDIEDFMALISPAAEGYLEPMAQMSQRYTYARFGKTMSMFIPLYLTNSCINSCLYCGFHAENHIPRTILTPEQIDAECRAIKALAPFENILLVTGENPYRAGVEYLREAIEIVKRYFDNVKIEVMPLASEDYSSLKQVGLNGVICFQETYNRSRYNIYHPRGMKANFDWRVNAPDRMGQAAVHSIGMGVLIGLEDWRTDVTMLAQHIKYLERRYWRTRYSVNFPRLRPAENGGFQPNVVMSDRELAQLTFAFRIFDHDIDISYSTREQAEFRDNMSTLGVTTFSAGSKTDPGGYATYPQSLEQFSVSDSRTPMEVAAALRGLGREVVWKDWDRSFDLWRDIQGR